MKKPNFVKIKMLVKQFLTGNYKHIEGVALALFVFGAYVHSAQQYTVEALSAMVLMYMAGKLLLKIVKQ